MRYLPTGPFRPPKHYATLIQRAAFRFRFCLEQDQTPKESHCHCRSANSTDKLFPSPPKEANRKNALSGTKLPPGIVNVHLPPPKLSRRDDCLGRAYHLAHNQARTKGAPRYTTKVPFTFLELSLYGYTYRSAGLRG